LQHSVTILILTFYFERKLPNLKASAHFAAFSRGNV